MNIPVFFPTDTVGAYHFAGKDERPLCGVELPPHGWDRGSVTLIVDEALCPACAALRPQYPELQNEPEPEILRSVYIFQLWRTDYYKIGVSKDTMQRLAGLRQASPIPIDYVWESDACPSRFAYWLEHKIHGLYDHVRLRYSNHREWFSLTEADVRRIQDIIRAEIAAG